jgi:hypothetical protein
LNCPRGRPGSPLNADGVAYDNGPVNGQVDAWTLNFGFSASDTIQVSGQVTGIQFWAWVEPGDTATSVEVAISSVGYFGNELFDGTVSLTQSNCYTNSFGFEVCQESGNFTGPSLSGNDWITLENASTSAGNPLYWDENSGVGCQSSGCPSMAQEDTLGTIPSEAFTLTGASTTSTQPPPLSCFEPDGTIQVLHDFDNQSSWWPRGVTIDKAGNLYGPAGGGDHGAGMIYKLAPTEGGTWTFTSLYSFAGSDTGSSPSPVIIDPDGALYGTANGGIPCHPNGNSYCGLIFRLRPPPFACATVFCNWREEVLYQFNGTDGSNPSNLTFDSAGNLYGIASGMAGGYVIFELTPSAGGWTEKVLYTFADDTPNSLVMGKDGNLYGAAFNGVLDAGTVFQLVPSGGSWTKNIIYTFQGTQNDGWGPQNLHQDSSGNLYGTSYYDIDCGDGYGMTFELSPLNGSWVFSASGLNYGPNFTYIDSFTADAAGNTYVAYSHYQYQYPWGVLYDWSEIGGGGTDWWTHDWFNPGEPLAVDSRYLYGTTVDCGTHQAGTVWSVPR